jgi:hypothetical protein
MLICGASTSAPGPARSAGFHLGEIAVGIGVEVVVERLPGDLLVHDPGLRGDVDRRVLHDQQAQLVGRQRRDGVDAFRLEEAVEGRQGRLADLRRLHAAERHREILLALEIERAEAHQATVDAARRNPRELAHGVRGLRRRPGPGHGIGGPGKLAMQALDERDRARGGSEQLTTTDHVPCSW